VAKGKNGNGKKGSWKKTTENCATEKLGNLGKPVPER